MRDAEFRKMVKKRKSARKRTQAGIMAYEERAGMGTQGFGALKQAGESDSPANSSCEEIIRILKTFSVEQTPCSNPQNFF